MEINQRPLGSIKPYEKNAKKHPAEQVEQIAASIREFGFNQPIVVDKAGVIIAGHGRYLAAGLLGMKMVPVLEVDIDEDQAKAYRLADNRLNETPWDMELVVAELKELSPPMIVLTGFDVNLILEPTVNAPKAEEVKCPRCQDILKGLDGHRRSTGHLAEYDLSGEEGVDHAHS